MSRAIPSKPSPVFSEVFDHMARIRPEHVSAFEAWQRARLLEPRIVERVMERLKECPAAVEPTGMTAYALERAGYDSWKARLMDASLDKGEAGRVEVLRSPTGAVFVVDGWARSTRDPIPSSSDPNANPPAGETPTPEGGQYPTRGRA